MSTNRYALTPEVLDDLVSPGTLRKCRWRIPEINMVGYTRYAITQADLKRIDLIAYRTLGDVQYWWAIAIVNNISNPFRDLEPGMVLKIPRIEEVIRALATGV